MWIPSPSKSVTVGVAKMSSVAITVTVHEATSTTPLREEPSAVIEYDPSHATDSFW